MSPSLDKYHLFRLFSIEYFKFLLPQYHSQAIFKWTAFTKNCQFCSSYGFPGDQTKKGQNSQFSNMFSNMKIEEYMESELSGIFK